jgi:hypothetical protein
MAQTLIPMKMAAGLGTPTMVNMPDATTLVPDATGLINVQAQHVIALMGAGWQIQITGGSTHVP